MVQKTMQSLYLLLPPLDPITCSQSRTRTFPSDRFQSRSRRWSENATWYRKRLALNNPTWSLWTRGRGRRTSYTIDSMCTLTSPSPSFCLPLRASDHTALPISNVPLANAQCPPPFFFTLGFKSEQTWRPVDLPPASLAHRPSPSSADPTVRVALRSRGTIPPHSLARSLLLGDLTTSRLKGSTLFQITKRLLGMTKRLAFIVEETHGFLDGFRVILWTQYVRDLRHEHVDRGPINRTLHGKMNETNTRIM